MFSLNIALPEYAVGGMFVNELLSLFFLGIILEPLGEWVAQKNSFFLVFCLVCLGSEKGKTGGASNFAVFSVDQ